MSRIKHLGWTAAGLVMLILVGTFAFLSNISRAQTSTLGTPLAGCWSVYADTTLGTPIGSLTGLAVVNPEDVWAVGSSSLSPDNSQALIKHWDGSKWSVVDSPNSGRVSSHLTTVAAVSKDSIWAFGGFRNETEGGILVMHWNGREWSQMPAPKLGEIKAAISAIAAVSDTDIWAVGTDFTNFSNQGGEKALIIHWNGQTWSIADLPTLTGNLSTLRGLVAVSADDVWAVGTNVGASNKFQPLLLHWDGTKWNAAPVPASVEAGQIYAVASTPSNDLWAVGVVTSADGFRSKTLTMHYDGQVWNVVSSPNSNDQYAGNTLRIVTAVSKTDVWAMGETLPEQPLFLHWDGSTWTNYTVPATPRLLKIAAADSSTSGDIWMLGEYYKGSAGGQTPAAPLVLRYASTPCLAPHPSPNTPSSRMTVPGSGSRLFPETGKTVSGVFLDYWNNHGGLMQQGLPISEPFMEKSDLDGKTYTVQYFERAVFEMHPENKPPYDVLLSQLGTFRLKAKYPVDTPFDASSQPTGNCITFAQTGKSACGAFLTYWQQHGGLAQEGYPVSVPFQETSDLDGKLYTVQYFERAVFEMHPENKPPYDVLLSQLGTFQLKQQYPAGAPGGTASEPATPQAPALTSVVPPTTQPTATPSGQAGATPTRKAGTNCEPVADSKKSKIAATGPVAIADVQYSGTEYVKLLNSGQSAAGIGGWVLRDKNDPEQRYTFPGGTQIPAGGSIQVYTEPGHPYSFNSKSSIWNNCGDALELLNASGAIVATYAYGTHVGP